MYVHIHLTEGDVPGLEGRETPAKGYYLPDDTKTSTPSPQVAVVSKQKPCTECQIGTVSCFDIGFDPLLIPSWESQIFVAVWKEMADYAGTNTCAAMAKSYEMVLNHEQKHHDQFMDLYAKPLMDAIDKLNVTYHYEYCSLAFDEPLRDRAVDDAAQNYKQRFEAMHTLFESWDAYHIAANALDDADYPLLDQAMPTDIRIKD